MDEYVDDWMIGKKGRLLSEKIECLVCMYDMDVDIPM